MSKYHKLLLFTIALIIAAGAIIWKIPMRQGLDLAGGARVVLEVKKSHQKDIQDNPDKMKAVVKVIESRVQGLAGVAEPHVQTQGKNRIIVELPGIVDKDKALAQIKDVAQLEFYWLRDLETEKNPSGKWERLTPPEIDAKTGEEIYSFRNKVTETVIRGDNEESRRQIILQVANAYDAIDNPKGIKPILTGNDLEAKSQAHLNTQTREAVVTVVFNARGREIFRDFTRKHVGDVVAIFLGGRMLTAPVINEAIPSGSAEISGFKDLMEAKSTAQYLNAGALPVPLEIVATDSVEATLGKETVDKALMAGIIGLILVAIFMLVYYRLPGFLADVALAIYAALTFAAFNLVGVTMTLPGFAGFILSIGMAVDANILIFERLKEELRSGKTLRASIDAGFSRAFTAIFDSNMCTVITSIILMWYGTGPVKSFALTLVIGVLISMFTAITVTRTFLHLLVSLPSAQKPWLFGLGTSWFAKPGRQLNIIGRRNLYFAFSGLLLAVGLYFYFTSGLKPGIEFQSGTSIQTTFKQPVTATEVNELVASAGIENEVQISEHKTAFIRTRLDPGKDGAKIKQLERVLEDKIEEGKTQIQSVGPLVSSELTRNAIWAVIIASIAIVIYLSFRFAIGGFVNGIKYGICAIAATLHDVIVIIGIVAALGYFLGWEIDTLFVTAVLTIIGFSTHDTIVVFDRIRENLRHRLKGEDFEALANRSILQTFSRSINTSFTVILTLAALTAFGGPLIRHFYIVLLVGIVSGTYSSIFNASPLLVVWEGIASRTKATGRRRLEDKPLVSNDRARDLKPLVTPNNGGVGDESEASRADSAKVKPKKKKRRY